ncbi:contact-dependent growth inhibition system immunity protein [Sphingomonas sp. CJ99]
MSRAKRECRKRIEERWPWLANMMGCYFNQDYDLLYGSLEGAIKCAVRDGSTEHRRGILKEWRDWKNSDGTTDDIRPLLDAMGVDLLFKSALDARKFMNRIYDELLLSVKSDTDFQQ